MDKIGVVILNYVNYDQTSETIISLMKSKFKKPTALMFYIVDNHSENDSLEEIEVLVSESALSKEFEFQYIQSDINGGYAKGINLGLRKAVSDGCDYVATVNPDITVRIDSLQELYSSLKDSEYAMLGPKIYKQDGTIDKTCARYEPTLTGFFFRLGIIQKLFPNNAFIREHYVDIENIDEGIVEVDIVSGAFMLYKSTVLKEIDYFDENTFLYVEEYIIHEKLKRSKYISGINTRSIVYHVGGGSSQEVVPSMFLINAELKSLEYFLKEYRGYPTFLIWMIIANTRLSVHLSAFVKRRKL